MLLLAALGWLGAEPAGAVRTSGNWQVVLAAAFLVAITLLVFTLRRTRPYLLVGWLWYLSMLVPVIGIVEVGLQGHADRYTYLPQIGLYIAITWLVADLSVSLRFRRKILAAAAIILVAALGVCAGKQTSYWRNSETLWTHTLAVTQNNDVAHTNLGMFLADRGQLDEALSHLQAALQIRSGAVQPHYDLSFALIHCDLGYALVQVPFAPIEAVVGIALWVFGYVWIRARRQLPDVLIFSGLTALSVLFVSRYFHDTHLLLGLELMGAGFIGRLRVLQP